MLVCAGYGEKLKGAQRSSSGLSLLLAKASIVIHLIEERSMVGQHIIEDVRDKIACHGDNGNAVSFARRLAILDALVHLNVLGHGTSQIVSQGASGIAAVARALFGDVFADEKGSARDVLGGSQSEKAGKVCAIDESVDIANLGDEG